MKEGWEYKKLGEVCQVIMGQSPDGSSINEFEGVEFHQGKTCFGTKFLGESKQYTTSPTKFAEANSVLLCVRAPVGFPNITNRKICIGRGLCSLSSTAELDGSFLFYALLGKQNYYEKNATGSTFKAISSKIVSNTLIPIPSLPNQQTIVSELDEINNLLSLKRKELETFDKLAQSLFYEMFGDPIENEKGWEVRKLGETCRKITDGTHDTPERIREGVKFITGKHIRAGFIDYDNSDYVTQEVHNEIYRRCNPEYGDVLYTNIGANLGTAAMNKVEYEFSMKNVALLKLGRTALNGYFVQYFLNDNRIKENIINSNANGGAQKFLSLKIIERVHIPLPPLPLQQLFASRIEAIEAQKAQVKAAIEKLETLLAARMQYWFD